MELFKLFGTIAVKNKEAIDALNETSETGRSTESKLNKAFNGIGKFAVGAGKVIASGMAIGAGAVAALTKSSVGAYAEYEQLVGGVDTLFKESSAKVQQYADNAYKTAGLSANAYMETVTSFSASLLQSLGGDTEKAADYADVAIRDMSDNANKMGTDMSLIQNAYQGFAKQNYTMLDNLKLGYGGTKEEMERLIEDANKVKVANGEMADLSIESFADVTEAIHIIQSEMGITGTTAKEAEGTIAGSIASTKSAWENLMTGLAQDNADIPTLVNNVLSSGTKVLENIIPVVKTILQNIPAAISEISPQAGAAFQGIMNICSSACDILKVAIETTFKIVSKVFKFVQDNTWVLTAAATAIGIIVTALGMYNAVAAIKAAMAAAEVTTVWGLVSAYAAQAVAMMAAIAPYLLIAAAIAAVIAIGVLLVKNWDKIKAKASEIASSVTSKFESMKSSVLQKFESIKNGIKEKFDAAKEFVRGAIEKMKSFFNFEWSLPKIKLPHFSISGKFSLNPPSIPKFSVDWYKKAYDNAMVLSNPTIFGYSPASGKLLGGGDGNGNEIVSGEEHLLNLIQGAVATQNNALADILYKILEAILAMDENMGGNLAEAMAGMGWKVNDREFARLVRKAVT